MAVEYFGILVAVISQACHTTTTALFAATSISMETEEAKDSSTIFTADILPSASTAVRTANASAFTTHVMPSTATAEVTPATSRPSTTIAG